MRRLALPLVMLALLSGGSAAAETLTILHTNDFHSRFEPISTYDSPCPPDDNAAGKCFGGAARLMTAVRAARAAADNVILVSGGDQFQGSLFYTTYKGKAAAEMMTALGYDAMTLGNHEFDDGPETLRGFLDAVPFPVLLANADVSGEPQLAGVLEPSTVIERGGEKIGLIGVTAEDTAELSSPGPRIVFQDPVAAVAREIAKLEAAGVSRIIVLSHAGYAADRRIAAAVDGIDVIVGGHSNTLLGNGVAGARGPYPTWVTTPNGGRTAIVQAYAYSKYLGRLEVTFDQDGTVVEATGGPLLLDGQVAEDDAVRARVAALAAPLEEIRNTVVGEAAAPIDGSRESCRARECAMGNLVAEAMLAHVKGQDITVAIINGGGLRASIDRGPITLGEVLTVLPFQNVLATFRLTGAEIVAALESGVSQVEEGKGRFPQVAGLRYAYGLDRTPNQGRIAKVEILQDGAWRPIDPQALYGVVSNNFLRGGGDGYRIFAEKARDAYDFGPSLEDVVVAFLATRRPYRPKTDGRIAVE